MDIYHVYCVKSFIQVRPKLSIIYVPFQKDFVGQLRFLRENESVCTKL